MKREQLAFRFVLIAFESDPACATVVVVKEIMRTAGIDKAWEYFIRETLTSWGWATEKPSFLSSRLLWTDEGRECARRLQQAARQKVWRDSHLHHALMTWTYEHSPAGGSADLEQFGDADDWWFAGTPVTWEEVIDAVQYLEAEGLLTVNRSDRFYVQPTSIGVKFMHSKEDLSTFLARQTRSAGGVAHHYRGSIVVHGDASGAALVTGDNNALTFNQGAGAIALRSFVAQLRQIAPSLSLPQDDAQDLAAEINKLELEGISPITGSRSWRSIRRILFEAVAAAATEDSQRAIQSAITTGSELFG